jgi:hypothetical protein
MSGRSWLHVRRVAQARRPKRVPRDAVAAARSPGHRKREEPGPPYYRDESGQIHVLL